MRPPPYVKPLARSAELADINASRIVEVPIVVGMESAIGTTRRKQRQRLRIVEDVRSPVPDGWESGASLSPATRWRRLPAPTSRRGRSSASQRAVPDPAVRGFAEAVLRKTGNRGAESGKKDLGIRENMSSMGACVRS